jgi:hypothetical protein
MTVIAGLIRNGVPLLLGDTVISTLREVAPETVYLPTIGRIIPVTSSESNYVPCDLVQKINTVSDYMLFAWAGDLIAARTMLKAIRDRSSAVRLPVTPCTNTLISIGLA